MIVTEKRPTGEINLVSGANGRVSEEQSPSIVQAEPVAQEKKPTPEERIDYIVQNWIP